MENGRVVRVFVENCVGGGADCAFETEPFADAAADDGLACAEVPVEGDLVADLQFLGELHCPVVCFFFACEFHCMLTMSFLSCPSPSGHRLCFWRFPIKSGMTILTSYGLQFLFKLLVREFVQQVELAVFVELADARVTHTVEERGLDHRVVDHVFKDDAVADLERFVEREIAELVAGEAGVARELVGVSLFTRECGADDVRTVRHFEAVRHVGADGNVEYCDIHFVVDDVANACDEFTGLPADGFARFHDDLQVRVACGEILEDAHEFVAVVILAGNVVATAEVHPLHLREVLAEVLFECGENAFESVGILFAKRMEVETVNAVKEFGLEFLFGHAEAGVFTARVVNVGFDCRKFRVHADAGTHAVGKRLVLVTLPLRKAVERDVVRSVEDGIDFVVFIDGGEDVDFLVHLFAGEAGFVEARGGGAGKVFADDRERTPETVTLEGADDFDAGLVLDIGEDFHIAAETCFVKYETRTWNLRIVEHGAKIERFGFPYFY